MNDAADDALLAAMVAGDREAATAFVRRFQRRVYGVAYGVLGDKGRADDVAQEAFLRAWRHGATFDARRGSVTTWLLALTRNLAIDVLRSQRIRPVEHLDALELRLMAGDVEPPAGAVAADERGRVVAALRSMPVEQRRAVVITALGGRTARELAEIDGIPLGTAKTRIRTGLRRLRDTLADERIEL
jgi:RNA polymerase sigma-70 factor (ECF subfamily)